MKTTIEGNYSSTRKYQNKEGKEVLYTTIFVEDEAVRIFGYDPGTAIKRFDPVKAVCDLRQTERGMMISIAK